MSFEDDSPYLLFGKSLTCIKVWRVVKYVQKLPAVLPQAARRVFLIVFENGKNYLIGKVHGR